MRRLPCSRVACVIVLGLAGCTPTAPEQAAAPEPAPELVALATTQPCLIVTKSVEPDATLDCIYVRALAVAGRPPRVCVPVDWDYPFIYDDRGRVVNDGLSSYTHGEGGRAQATWLGDADPGYDRLSPATFDDQGRILSSGGSRYTYDDEGRLIRSDHGKRYLMWTYAADGTYLATNNYPDSDEECEADLVELTRNARGLNEVEVYDGCMISDTPRTMRYVYDAAGRAISIEVDNYSDGTVDYTITADYSCHERRGEARAGR
jgi:hypothetical protein